MQQELTPHAIYMRLRRLCEKKASGRLQVTPEIHDQWARGCRDELRLAMVNALKIHGTEDSKKTRDAVRVLVCQNNQKIELIEYI